MIRKISLLDIDRFNELGLLVNSNFKILFKLEELVNSSYDFIFGYYDNDQLIGFVHVSKMYEVVDIVNVVVDVNNRRIGIATELLNYVFNFFSDVTSYILEVNEKNSCAILLYQKLGFKLINTRKKYYGNDHAYIMKRDVL